MATKLHHFSLFASFVQELLYKFDNTERIKVWIALNFLTFIWVDSQKEHWNELEILIPKETNFSFILILFHHKKDKSTMELTWLSKKVKMLMESLAEASASVSCTRLIVSFTTYNGKIKNIFSMSRLHSRYVSVISKKTVWKTRTLWCCVW